MPAQAGIQNCRQRIQRKFNLVHFVSLDASLRWHDMLKFKVMLLINIQMRIKKLQELPY